MKNLRFGRNMWSECKILFSGLQNGTSLHETTSFDVLIVKTNVGVSALENRQPPKKEKKTSLQWAAGEWNENPLSDPANILHSGRCPPPHDT